MVIPSPLFNFPGTAQPGTSTGVTPTSSPTSSSSNTQTQQQTPSSGTTQPSGPQVSSNFEVKSVNPPLTPDQIVGLYDAPITPPSLPTFSVPQFEKFDIGDKTLSQYLKSIEQKMTSVEKLMDNIVKLQNLHVQTEKELFNRKQELYQNTFEEYILDKTVGFNKTDDKDCVCLNLKDQPPPPVPVTPPGLPTPPSTAPSTQTQTKTQTQTQTQNQPQTQPNPSPIFDPKGWNEPQFSPNQPPAPKPTSPPGGWQLPPWLKLPPIPPVPLPRLPDLEGLGGLASQKMNDYGKILGIDGTSFASVVAQFKPIAEKLKKPITDENKKVLWDNAVAIAESAGMTAEQSVSLVLAVLGAAFGLAQSLSPVLNNASGGIIPFASGGVPGGDLELYDAKPQKYFKNLSRQLTTSIPNYAGGGLLNFAGNLLKNVLPKPKGLNIKGVQAGFTGMAKQGFDAIMGGDKFRLGSWKPQILGRGAYSAPTIQGAQRYAGSTGSLGGKQTPGGVVKTIVPGNARRINILEPQAAVKPQTFDKGKILADKLLGGAYANSPLANKLRMQLITGTAQNVGMGLGKLLSKGTGLLNAPVISDMLFPEATAAYDQVSGPNAYYNAPGYKGPMPSQALETQQDIRRSTSEKPTIVPLPPDYVSVPRNNTSKPTQSSTIAPPPAITTRKTIFSRSRSGI